MGAAFWVGSGGNKHLDFIHWPREEAHDDLRAARDDGNHRLSPRVVSLRLFDAGPWMSICIGGTPRLETGGHRSLGTISTHFTPEVASKNHDCCSDRPFAAASGTGEQNRQS